MYLIFPSQPNLHLQVEKLSSKSHNLEAELERKSKLLEEAKTQAVKESEKNRAAEEVIKCLAAQVRLFPSFIHKN